MAQGCSINWQCRSDLDRGQPNRGTASSWIDYVEMNECLPPTNNGRADGLAGAHAGQRRCGPAGSWRFPFLATLLLLLLALAWEIPLLQCGYFGDDPRHLATARRPEPLGRVLGHGTGREVDYFFFTPLLGLSVALDWRLSGLDPRGYNVHNLVSLWLAGLSALLLLRVLGVGMGVALVGAAAFISAPATLSVASYISTRHYLEGAIWAMLAVAFCLKWRERKRWPWLAGGGACYELAALSKEIYVPLLLVVGLVGMPRERRRRYLLVGAMVAALCAYFGGRVWNHGTVLGGYTPGHHSVVALVAALVQHIPLACALVFLPPDTANRLGETGTAAIGATLLAIVFVSCWLRRGGRSAVGFLAVLYVLLAPAALVLEHGGSSWLLARADGHRLIFPFASALLLGAVWVVQGRQRPGGGRRAVQVVAASALVLAMIPGGAGGDAAVEGAASRFQ